MKFQSKAERKSMWLGEFDIAVCNAFPACSGRIDWNSALHFFYSGLTPKDAAERYLSNPDHLPENAVRLVRF